MGADPVEAQLDPMPLPSLVVARNLAFHRVTDPMASLPVLRELHLATMYADIVRVVGWDDAVQDGRLRKTLARGALYLAHAPALAAPAGRPVAEPEGRPERPAVGSFVLIPRDHSLYLSNLYIAPAWQGAGFGTAVLRALKAHAARREAPLRLSVLHGSPALRLYEREGFVSEGADTRWEHILCWRPTIAQVDQEARAGGIPETLGRRAARPA